MVALPVPREWTDLFITAAGGDGDAPEQAGEEASARRGGFFRRLRE